MLCNFYFTKGNGFFESSSIETVKFRQVRNKIIDLKNNKTSLYKTETLYQEIIKMKNAADRNRTSTDTREPHRKEDCATSADSCTIFVQLFCTD